MVDHAKCDLFDRYDLNDLTQSQPSLARCATGLVCYTAITCVTSIIDNQITVFYLIAFLARNVVNVVHDYHVFHPILQRKLLAWLLLLLQT